ncbi:MAG: hypothetical protein R3185_06725, partial [Candidatus Thermoplasmatota archaeon]|nr:hypothetical protein [Candidatus Thermoplasmatota archaeon]
MQPKLWLVILSLLLLAGCLTGQAGPGPAEGPDAPGARVGQGQDAPDASGVPAPTLRPGTAFTFATAGLQDGEEEVTAVVARSGPDGYLLAGADQGDLATGIAFSRWWLGPVDAHLNPQHPETGERMDHILSFPLYNGKTWPLGNHNVTARAAPVPVPGGLAEGFEMRWGYGRGNLTWTYAPSIGYLTTYQWEEKGTVLEAARLTDVGQASAWTWYEELRRT